MTSRSSGAGAVRIYFTELQRIGIYGGTFDPVHHAHLILAREAAERFELAKVIFIPAATSPFKPAPFAPAQARLEMLRAAIEDEAIFEIDDCELLRPPPSYTVETIELLRETHSDSRFFLLIGDDNLAGLPRWRRFEDLRQMVSVVVLPRAQTAVRHEYQSVDRRVDISATEIRARVQGGQPIRYLVPAAVEEMIKRERLYQEVTQSNPNL